MSQHDSTRSRSGSTGSETIVPTVWTTFTSDLRNRFDLVPIRSEGSPIPLRKTSQDHGHDSGCDSISLRFLKDSPTRALHLSAAQPDLAHLIVKRVRCTSRCEGGRPCSPEGKKASVNGGGEELKLMKSRGMRRLAVFVPVPEDAPVRSSSSNLLRDVVLGYNTCRFGPEVTLQPYFIPRHSWCDPRLWFLSFLQTQS